MARWEDEHRITEEEFSQLIAERDRKREAVHKCRYAFLHQDQHFELDIIWHPIIITLLEIEIPNEKTPIILPRFVPVIREVTEDDRYGNGSIAAGLCPGYK